MAPGREYSQYISRAISIGTSLRFGLDPRGRLPSATPRNRTTIQNLALTHIPLLVSPLLDQNHLHDALYRLLATTPVTSLNDDIIAVCGERRARIHPYEVKKQ